MLSLVSDYRMTEPEEDSRAPEPPPHTCVADADDLIARYETLRDRARAELDAGHLQEALQIYNAAQAVAEGCGDQALVDLAFCNRTAVEITLGELHGICEPLRDVLVRNHGNVTNGLAAYNLSRAYESLKEGKKALFYGRIFLNYAKAAGDESWVAAAHNQIGNCLLAESYFDEAIAEYRQALGLLGEELSVIRVGLLNNLAYAKIVVGEPREAFRLLFQCLRWYRRSGFRLYEAWPHLDLCYAYLEIGRLRWAWDHGRKALQVAETIGDQNAIKLALFLLGSVEKAGGDLGAAYDHYHRLQREFYPEVANLPEMMLVYDARKIVNLRA